MAIDEMYDCEKWKSQQNVFSIFCNMRLRERVGEAQVITIVRFVSFAVLSTGTAKTCS